MVIKNQSWYHNILEMIFFTKSPISAYLTQASFIKVEHNICDVFTYEHIRPTKNLNLKVPSSMVTQDSKSACYNLKAAIQVLVSCFGSKMNTKKKISFKCK